MKIAISHWQGRLAPVFDVSREVMIYDTESGERQFLPLNETPYEKAGLLKREGAELLLCGAMSRGMLETVETFGIKAVPFLCGDVDQVITHWKESLEEFRMPGCCRRRQRGYGRPRWGRQRHQTGDFPFGKEW
ncbi:MAG TPA: NifB/NifX family molybdenum-iron cluster-binding protein [Candidatus Mcinerneyibacteriales bacterium]|nr:NifB/NifX family molybdenum-iron cluster-binding protein [Candidatus Mcinerneyibacteriales bacterium]